MRLVLEQAGALPHDEADQRLVREFRQREGSCGAPDRRRNTPFPPPATGTPLPDQDQDGIPDEWDRQHHLNAADATDCWADPDDDGYSNLEEYLNGTDPGNPWRCHTCSSGFAPKGGLAIAAHFPFPLRDTVLRKKWFYCNEACARTDPALIVECSQCKQNKPIHGQKRATREVYCADCAPK